jgi:hypothetical protein
MAVIRRAMTPACRCCANQGRRPTDGCLEGTDPIWIWSPESGFSRSRQAADAVSSDGVIAQCDHGCVKTSEWKTMPENVAGLQTIDWLRLTDRSFAEWALRPPQHQGGHRPGGVHADDTQNAARSLMPALVAVAGCGWNRHQAKSRADAPECARASRSLP